MMLVAAFLTAAVGTLDPDISPSPALESFVAETSVIILEGRELPHDYRQNLLKMPPADRLLAIIYLRRSGLLKGNIWAIEDILRPPEDQITGGTAE